MVTFPLISILFLVLFFYLKFSYSLLTLVLFFDAL